MTDREKDASSLCVVGILEALSVSSTLYNRIVTPEHILVSREAVAGLSDLVQRRYSKDRCRPTARSPQQRGGQRRGP